MRKAAALLVTIYQKIARSVLPPSCRFHPSCSDFAREAVLVHGFWRGFWLTITRLARCQPFHPGGFDPVPPVQGHSHG